MPEMEPVLRWRDKFDYFAKNRKEETGRMYPASEAIEFIKEQAVITTANILYIE